MKRRISKCARCRASWVFKIDRMQIQAAAKHIIAAGDDDGLGAALAFLYLIERQVHRADDGDIDRVAHRRALDAPESQLRRTP